MSLDRLCRTPSCHPGRQTLAVSLLLALSLLVPPTALAGARSTPGSRPGASDSAEGGGGAASLTPSPRLWATSPAPERSTALSPLAARLAQHPQALQYGEGGSLEAVFGVPAAEASLVFYPVSRTRALPDGYEPSDLVNNLGLPIRALVVGEFRAMFAAAERQGASPEVVSGYRSAAYQAVVFERAVQRQLGRDEALTREEAEGLAAHFVAPPGHSQHQLGTTADLSSWEIGYSIRRDFAETAAGHWLAEHAWEYGFVLPYTAAAEPRTGYIPEPWHLRWIGRPLAAFLWEQQYLTSGYPTADDYLLALEELLASPTPGL